MLRKIQPQDQRKERFGQKKQLGKDPKGTVLLMYLENGINETESEADDEAKKIGQDGLTVHLLDQGKEFEFYSNHRGQPEKAFKQRTLLSKEGF